MHQILRFGLTQVTQLRPVSIQENKHRIGLDFFPSCIIRTAGPKKLKILQLFIIRVADHRFKPLNWFKLEQKIGTESHARVSENRRVSKYEFKLSKYEFKLSKYEFKLSKYEFKLSKYEFKLSTYGFKLSKYEFKLSQYEFKLSKYEFKLSKYEF